MAIGGRREGAGRKSKWRSPTKLIRIPANYEVQILEFAKRLDSVSESEAQPSWSLSEVEEMINYLLLRLPPKERIPANKLFKRFLKLLRTKDSSL